MEMDDEREWWGRGRKRLPEEEKERSKGGEKGKKKIGRRELWKQGKIISVTLNWRRYYWVYWWDKTENLRLFQQLCKTGIIFVLLYKFGIIFVLLYKFRIIFDKFCFFLKVF